MKHLPPLADCAL